MVFVRRARHSPGDREGLRAPAGPTVGASYGLAGPDPDPVPGASGLRAPSRQPWGRSGRTTWAARPPPLRATSRASWREDLTPPPISSTRRTNDPAQAE